MERKGWGEKKREGRERRRERVGREEERGWGEKKREGGERWKRKGGER